MLIAMQLQLEPQFTREKCNHVRLSRNKYNFHCSTYTLGGIWGIFMGIDVDSKMTKCFTSKSGHMMPHNSIFHYL